MTAVIRFYRTVDPYGEFSNFARFPIRCRGVVWPTSEALFQAAKFPDDPGYQERIRCAGTPSEAAALGRDPAAPLRPDWDVVRDEVMRRVLRLKFTQHPDLGQLLLGTGDATIVEHTHRDRYWGDGGDGSGRNRLGALLMELRAILVHMPAAHMPAPGVGRRPPTDQPG
jgi:ribA/ribD-fused uncharacterized protein